MIIFTQTKTTKCYGVTVLRRYGVTALWQMQLRHSVTASVTASMQEGKCNCATVQLRNCVTVFCLMTLCSCVAVSLCQ